MKAISDHAKTLLETVEHQIDELQPLPDGEIDFFLRDRVCARCYGDLVKVPAPDRKWLHVCPECGDLWNGATVSRLYAERLGQKALAELWEVWANLPDLFPRSHKSEAEILAELGF